MALCAATTSQGDCDSNRIPVKLKAYVPDIRKKLISHAITNLIRKALTASGVALGDQIMWALKPSAVPGHILVPFLVPG